MAYTNNDYTPFTMSNCQYKKIIKNNRIEYMHQSGSKGGRWRIGEATLPQ